LILHLCVLQKFIEPFYSFVKDNFGDFSERHLFYINRNSLGYRMPGGDNIYLAQAHEPYARYIWLIKQMNQAEKIILHSLGDYRVLQLLAAQPWLLKKCYWVIWGADLYTYQFGTRNLAWRRRELFRRYIIKRIGHFITHVKGDFELAKQWYGARGIWHECFMYPSNLYHEYPIEQMPHDGINILVGNSADPSNNHIEVLESLRIYASKNICIYCPLSYGDTVYASKVANCGQSLFGTKFVAMRDFISHDKYLDFLAQIDIAIFNHRRQQGMGNITTLLGFGKKVYIRNDVTSWHFFRHLGVQINDVKSADLTRIKVDDARRNNIIIADYFSVVNLRRQWNLIYGQ